MKLIYKKVFVHKDNLTVVYQIKLFGQFFTLFMISKSKEGEWK